MKIKFGVHILITVIVGCQSESNFQFIDNKSLPLWYENAKFGLRIDLSLESVTGLAKKNELLWKKMKEGNVAKINTYMNKNYPPKFSYPELAKEFHAYFFNPDDWVDFFTKSGARYIIVTAKGHDGFCLWDSAFSPVWNSYSIGPQRDFLSDLSRVIREKSDLHFGIHYTFEEWCHPIFLKDLENNFNSKEFPSKKIHPEVKDLVQKYKPELLWFDGFGKASDDYWDTAKLLQWIVNYEPVKNSIVINDRISSIPCLHGMVMTNCTNFAVNKKWERIEAFDKYSLHDRKDVQIADVLETEELIGFLITTVSKGGNFLLNIGVTKEGIIPVLYRERLLRVGKWLKINGEAIYGSRKWSKCFVDTYNRAVWYTTKTVNREKVVYGIILKFPKFTHLYLGCLQLDSKTKITLLGNENLKDAIKENTASYEDQRIFTSTYK